jgi:hypothetical protein
MLTFHLLTQNKNFILTQHLHVIAKLASKGTLRGVDRRLPG